MERLPRRKLLVASVGIAAISYVAIACGKDTTPPISGNLPSPPPTSTPIIVGNLPAPPPVDASTPVEPASKDGGPVSSDGGSSKPKSK